MYSDKDRWPNVFPVQPKRDRVASVAEDECLAYCRYLFALPKGFIKPNDA